MKKWTFIFAVILVVGLTAFCAPVHGASVTDKNIKDGLEFCSQYPITLKYNESAVSLPSGSVAPIIITPDGHENGWTLIPARALFEAAGATVDWNEKNQMVTIKYDNTEILLTIGASNAKVNGTSKSLDLPALIISNEGNYYGSTMIPVRFVAENLGFGVTWIGETRTVKVTKEKAVVNEEQNNNNNSSNNNNNDDKNLANINLNDLPKASIEAAKKVVVIDVGHGGKDSGSIGHKGKSDEFFEKDVNLKAALALEKYLKAAGIETVLMTRSNDIYLGLYDRPAYANEKNADLFISVHNNSSEKETPKGTEVHYYDKVNEENKTEMDLYGIKSKDVATAVQNELIKYLGTLNRGVKQSPALAVLNKTKMPAIIVEGAFLSNESDLMLMRSSDYAENYGFACAKGIVLSLNAAYGS